MKKFNLNSFRTITALIIVLISGTVIAFAATTVGPNISTGNLTTGADGADGQLTIYSEQGGTDYSVVFQPHAAMTQATTYTLPADDGNTSEMLTTDGSGALSWSSAGVGDITAVGDITTGAAFTATAGADGNSLYFEGSSGDANEVLLTAADPGADFTVTIPAVTGTLYISNGNDVAVADGGTGASDAAGAKGNLGFMTDLADDASPQLGGNLDLNSSLSLLEGAEEVLIFTDVATAVNEVTIGNAATGNPTMISATGDDVNIGLTLSGKGTGVVTIGSDLAANGAVTIGDDGDTVAINSSDWDISATGDMTGIGSITMDGSFELTDNVADTFDVEQGSDNYINIDTTDGSEVIAIGNAANNPDIKFLGSGNVIVDGNFVVKGVTAIGDGGDHIALWSDDWEINNSGVMTGIDSISNSPDGMTITIGDGAGDDFILTDGTALLTAEADVDKVTLNYLLNLTPVASPPGSPVNGDIYYDDGAEDALCARVKGAWVVLAGAGTCD